MNDVVNRTPRKPDLISYLAIFLFVFVGLFEVALVVYLPNKLRSEKGMEEEMAKQLMNKMVDNLRHKTNKLKDKVKTGEVELVDKCLNDLARYIRLSEAEGSVMNRDQVREVMEDLSAFETIIRHWDSTNKSFLTVENIDSKKYLSEVIDKKLK